ncbi:MULTISPECIES: ABC transporter ATP-binding protein [Aeribacillus]|jgi:ABC-2 type transport system ATP-binding protein|uniref:ABC transporter ATP-binding protein n=2 Tax=Bacillaceae TaxID=186817 RepID=UPI0007B4F354|nr:MULTISPECIES: ABC transporter ATP-binding protein [Aeribacillus]KZM52585.1 ABC transporter ATP-binding protein [Aeribacillus pallidus]MDR9796114.1 ABC transporter ATP-binding protein [Aeribacillus pallidus]MED0652430.1 ABC transporter ATP-binding protein [Aeribacillus composti]MED0716805.1 ABC transporter ATP-binding protein [Aeribacillus composti]MED4485308.1 ABC transporter ATP-binding protein [Aeribacillus pallidus]
MYVIETYNLTKKYGNKNVVNNVSLKVKKGIIFGFLGKNGAGKSTFINMITGLTIPSSGSFTLLSNKNIKEQRKRFGVMPDYSEFYGDMTAFDHLKFFSKLLGIKLTREDIIQILKRVGLEDAINLKTKKFSFGMKKKLGIAQAILNKPDLLFLDEPTSGVDANSILSIHSLIKDISKQGTTIFLTSHNLDEVEKLCDEIAIIDKGIIKLQGPIEKIKSDYRDNLTIIIKHGKIPENVFSELEYQLKMYSSNITWGMNHVHLMVKDEYTISEINRLFLKMNINVFRIEVEEPTLEEIFLGT